MERINFMEAKMDDIIFHNRNKAYGAYVLRNDYGSHVRKAMFMGYSFFASLLLIPAISNLLTADKPVEAISRPFELTDLSNIIQEIIPSPPAGSPKPATGPTDARSEMRVTQTPVDNVQDSMPANTPPAPFDGPVTAGATDVFTIGNATGTNAVTIPEIPAPTTTDIVNVAEEMPQFKGGEAAMKRFISQNMQYPVMAKDMDIEGKVVIGFVVNTDGTVVDVKVLKGLGGGCSDEATRVIKMMPPFTPGKMGGKPVRVRYAIPIAFKLN